jgi:hypothetical protein
VKAVALCLLVSAAHVAAASAASVKLSRAQVNQGVAGALTETSMRTNPTGNSTQGKVQAITATKVTANPSGNAAPGHNK